MSTGYEGRLVQGFKLYLKQSKEHETIKGLIDKIVTNEFARLGEGKAHLNVLGVGSGGGEMDVHMLSVLQSELPATPFSVDIVEPSIELTENFKALVAKTPNLQKVPFTWNTLTCAEYEKLVKDKAEVKRFDFMHMIQMLYYTDDCAATIKFFHSLLKEKGKLLIIHEAANTGWEKLWKTYKKELCSNSITNYMSAGDIKAHLDDLGLKYEEHQIPNTLDITECFVKENETGELLLDFMTDREHFHQSFTPEVRAEILDFLRNKCSTERNGRIFFDCSISGLLVYA